MHIAFRSLVLAAALAPFTSLGAQSAGASRHRNDIVPYPGISQRPSDYSNGYGTNAANSEAVGAPVGPYGGYVVNQYGFGNYVSGPAGYGGYPAGSAGAEIYRQRERWKCRDVPESC